MMGRQVMHNPVFDIVWVGGIGVTTCGCGMRARGAVVVVVVVERMGSRGWAKISLRQVTEIVSEISARGRIMRLVGRRPHSPSNDIGGDNAVKR